MKIEINKKTKIDLFLNYNSDLGRTFTDHMFVCDYQDGQWSNPRITPMEMIPMHPACMALHYGQALFEGMKATIDTNGKVWMFRPKENWLRLNKSCERMMIPGFPEKIFMEALNKLIYLDKDWIKPGIGNSLYIRPFIFANQASLNANM